MRIEIWILLVFGFLAVNAYYEGYYLDKLKSYKKFYKVSIYAFLGIILYLFIKKKPTESHSLLKHAHGIIKYMPIDKQSKDFLSPIFSYGTSGMGGSSGDGLDVYENKILSSGGGSGLVNSAGGVGKTKRCVSETKKKYVASKQNWMCKKCGDKLTAWFEVDHIMRLDRGGSNHVDNLQALCRNCHGEVTAMENM
jgi:hypothetical protein